MKRLKLGIIGLGIGRYYLDALRQLREAEAVAVCDIDAGKLAQCGEDFGISHRYTDYRELLADPAVEAVCVCTRICCTVRWLRRHWRRERTCFAKSRSPCTPRNAAG